MSDDDRRVYISQGDDEQGYYLTQDQLAGNRNRYWKDVYDLLMSGQRQDITPKYGNVPTFEQWAQSQGLDPSTDLSQMTMPGMSDGNPYAAYLGTFYDLPNYEDTSIFAQMPAFLGAAVLGGGILGGFDQFLAGAGAGDVVAGASGAGELLGGAGADTLGGTVDLGNLFPNTGGLPATDFSIGTGAGSATGATVPIPGFPDPSIFTTNLSGGGTVPLSSVGPGAVNATPPATNGINDFLSGLGNGSVKIPGTDITIPGNVLSGILQGVGGYLGAGQQADAYNQVAQQYMSMGAPFRNMLQDSYKPDFDLWSQPGYKDAFDKAADVSSRAWSAKSGNPYGSPTAKAGILSDVMNMSYMPALANYRGQLGQFGGLGINTSGAASLASAGTTGDEWEAFGSAANTIFNPQPKWDDIFKKMQGNSGNTTITIAGNPWR